MKRCIIILTVGLLIPSLVALSPLASSPNTLPAGRDGVGLYTDDSYYWAQSDTMMMPTEPVYDRNAREFIFLEDTTQYPDTVVMRIVEK
jgi:hypothetical protein